MASFEYSEEEFDILGRMVPGVLAAARNVLAGRVEGAGTIEEQFCLQVKAKDPVAFWKDVMGLEGLHQKQLTVAAGRDRRLKDLEGENAELRKRVAPEREEKDAGEEKIQELIERLRREWSGREGNQ